MTHARQIIHALYFALLTGLAGLSTPAFAGAVEGGIIGEMGWFGFNRTSFESTRTFAPPVCLGVVVQSREGWRVGGEAVGCGAYKREGIGSFYTGPRLGYLARFGVLRVGTMTGFGLGVYDDQSVETGHRTSLFSYLKPGVTLGFQLGGLALEGELYAMLPIQWAQWIHQDSAPSAIVQTGVGLRVGILFGRSPRRQAAREARKQERIDARAQLAAPAPQPVAPAQVNPYAAPAPADPPVYQTPDLPGMPPEQTRQYVGPSQPAPAPSAPVTTSGSVLAVPVHGQPKSLERPPVQPQAAPTQQSQAVPAQPAPQGAPSPLSESPLAIPAAP